MKMSERRSNKRRVAGSYAMSLMSIMLVLFLLGVFALLMMHAQILSNHIKENIGFEIVMNSNVKEANILYLQKELDANPAVKSTEYITKDEAIRRLSEDLGEDFLQWLGNEENRIDAAISGKLTNSVRASAIGMESQMAICPMMGESVKRGIKTKTMERHKAMMADSNGRSMAVWKLLPMMLTNDIK